MFRAHGREPDSDDLAACGDGQGPVRALDEAVSRSECPVQSRGGSLARGMEGLRWSVRVRPPAAHRALGGAVVSTSVTSASIVRWPVAAAIDTRWWPSLTKCWLPTRYTSIGGIDAPRRCAADLAIRAAR